MAIDFSFEWNDEEGTSSAAGMTWGNLTLVLEEYEWLAGDFPWTWIELLEWLNTNWDTLMADAQGEEAEKVKRSTDVISLSAQNDENFWHFLNEHDLRQSLQGAKVESLVIWREADLGHIFITGTYLTVPWVQLNALLNKMGNVIVERLNNFPLDERAEIAVKDWNEREVL